MSTWGNAPKRYAARRRFHRRRHGSVIIGDRLQCPFQFCVDSIQDLALQCVEILHQSATECASVWLPGHEHRDPRVYLVIPRLQIVEANSRECCIECGLERFLTSRSNLLDLVVNISMQLIEACFQR
jgi:hypothetical protein